MCSLLGLLPGKEVEATDVKQQKMGLAQVEPGLGRLDSHRAEESAQARRGQGFGCLKSSTPHYRRILLSHAPMPFRTVFNKVTGHLGFQNENRAF